MTLHPIRILDQVLDEYRDYLLTEFRAKDPNLRAALERELDAPGFLAQETFYQAHRPFRTGKRWQDLPLDSKLAAVMEKRSRSAEAYLHQSQAIEELLSTAANPVVVTTGTGSGKTEAFLLPVIQNAFEDSVRFKKSGLTAILVYPMNALANDQRQRIEDYLNEAGMAGAIRVEQYDRGTSQTKRQEMRANPPHILLTNYMMLEYLLVRPADREDIFANHRCRFLVLDEVHTYRGILGTNIALLVRRLRAHLARARQDWKPDVPDSERPKRYPKLIPIGTSATIKSLFEEGLSREEIIRLRDESVKEFFGNLTGADRNSIRVFGEELKELQIPPEATYPDHPGPVNVAQLRVDDGESVRQALCSLAQLPLNTSLPEAVCRYRLLWDLNRWLIKRPMSVSQIIEVMRREVPQRVDCTDNELRAEVEAALVIGAALPDETPGALRLRAHRFVRGGWEFHRCVNPCCGRLYPKGEERCTECNHVTAPLYLCRNCGADYLRFAGDIENEPLRPSADMTATPEWMVYEPSKFDSLAGAEEDEDDIEEDGERRPLRGRARVPAQIRRRPVLDGSLDPSTLQFSNNPEEYSWKVTLAPARTRCLCCGGTAGSRNVITPVGLGTSAAIKVLSEGLAEGLAEANSNRPGHDGKERLLLFSDSRQDAAHQARFIIFASRYDRMRRRLMDLLMEQELTVQRAVELLSESAVSCRDNPHVPLETNLIPEDARNRIQAWEEAPLLDEIAVNAGYRATLVNLGLVGIRYHQLDEYVQAKGENLAGTLGVNLSQLTYICRVMLDDMRVRGALSRPMLQYHPAHISCPAHLHAAEWERTVKQPRGYPLTPQGQVAAVMDGPTISGVTVRNAWRRPRAGGRGPSLERILRHLLTRFGKIEPNEQMMTDVLRFLQGGSFILPYTLYGFRKSMKLAQVNAETIRLHVLHGDTRLRCEVCGDVRSGPHAGMPCSQCHGKLVPWADTEVEQNRTVRRIRKAEAVPLVAGEHTAQITTDARAELETNFKAAPEVSPVNVLACSPTLEMGIDVGGLDAVVMRNVPPRPDNYAQRGGRAGRRSRVGMVVCYARSTPHDQYFYDKPAEMIGGEVPAPALSLGNRDVLIRHLHAIVFGAAEPGLAGRMIEYVGPDGAINDKAVDALIQGVQAQREHAAEMARQAWGDEILARTRIDEKQLREHLEGLPDRIRHVIDATSRQVIKLRQALDSYARSLKGRRAGVRAGDLVARLLGIPTASCPNVQDADDRSAGYPLRRFAEFGLLPGYEFPSEPATLRLLGDEHEEDPISVTRRFGLGQFQPDAHVYARKRRWVVIGLDNSSPWNPRSEGPTWNYRVCGTCGLRYNADEPSCPRCGTNSPGGAYPAYDFAGFLAKKEERPILDEEDRYAARNLVTVHPQWTGDVVGRWSLVNGWGLRLSRNEEVRWVNEGLPPTRAESENPSAIFLHLEAKGYLLCPSCGRKLEPPPPPQVQDRGRRNAGVRAGHQDTGGHADGCRHIGAAPRALAITTAAKVEVLRLLMPVPESDNARQWLSLGLSLGYALLNGMQRRFMLDPAELEFQLEGPWTTQQGEVRCSLMSLAFIDPGLGGSGYLQRIAEDFHLVAERALEHLDHVGCDTACYRCLKTYQNQRYHDQLHWPSAIPALHELAEQAPTDRPLQTGDIDDPRPWLEAYAAGVGSPLELKFLRLFEKHGFRPEKQVPVSPIDGEPPISVADFAVPERRLAIYVDGAAFHVGANLRRDRYIRGRLRDGQPPWRVEELRASDLKEGELLVKRLIS